MFTLLIIYISMLAHVVSGLSLRSVSMDSGPSNAMEVKLEALSGLLRKTADIVEKRGGSSCGCACPCYCCTHMNSNSGGMPLTHDTSPGLTSASEDSTTTRDRFPSSSSPTTTPSESTSPTLEEATTVEDSPTTTRDQTSPETIMTPSSSSPTTTPSESTSPTLEEATTVEDSPTTTQDQASPIMEQDGSMSSEAIISASCVRNKCENLPGGQPCSQSGTGKCDRFSDNEGESCRTSKSCFGGECIKPYGTFCSVCCGGDSCDKTLSLITSTGHEDLNFKCAAADPTNELFEE